MYLTETECKEILQKIMKDCCGLLYEINEENKESTTTKLIELNGIIKHLQNYIQLIQENNE